MLRPALFPTPLVLVLTALLALVRVAPAADLDQLLLDATRSQDLEAVARLLDQGADVNAQTDYGATALTYAADRGNAQLVRLLLDRGAQINNKDRFYQMPAIAWAVFNGHIEVVELLLQRASEGASFVLMHAVNSDNLAMLKTVLAAADLSAQDLSKALGTAQRAERQLLVEALQAAGAVAPPPAPSAEKTVPAPILQSYAGRYANADLGMELTFRLEEGKLIGQASGQPALTYAPEDEFNFKAVEFDGIAVEFRREDDQVSGFVLRQGGGEFFFARQANKPKEEVPAAPPPAAASPGKVQNWTSFRGPQGAGAADGAGLPHTWEVESGKNVKWKTPIPGLGLSSPVVWEDKVFVTTAISSDSSAALRVGLYGDVAPDEDLSEHQWKIYCLDTASGHIRWEHTAHRGVPQVKRHTKATQANSTPVTNGQYVVALFGAEGLYCYDLDGTLRWQQDLGRLDAGWFFDADYQWGHASSPIIYQDLVIVQCDRSQDSFIAAYALDDGRQVWSTARPEIPSWSTPAVFAADSGAELVANGTRGIRAYDPRSGAQLWTLSGNSEIVVPTPLFAHGLIFVTSGYAPIEPIYAIRPGGRGDISLADGQSTNAHIAWSTKRGGPYLPTPIVYGDYLYTCANNGALTCYRADSGEVVYKKRIDGRGGGYAFTASAVAADGHLYYTSEDGEVYVIQAGPQFKRVAKNEMGEVCLATPAIAPGLLLVRTDKHLFALGR